VVAVPSIGRATQVTPRRGAPEADATRDLYERYARQIYTYCLHQLGNREEAEDAVQSTFLNAFRGFQRGVDPEFESAWIYKIAQNVCLTRQRSSSRRRRIESASDLDAMQDYVPAHEVDPDELINLPEALDAMPHQQRKALLLREWQGLSYREIAEELDLSQAAVETLLFRARRSLAAGLGEEPVKKAAVQRLRSGGDAGSVLAVVKSLLFTGGAKVAVTVATVAATSVVAATPATRHAVEAAVAPTVPGHARPYQYAGKSQPGGTAATPRSLSRTRLAPAGLPAARPNAARKGAEPHAATAFAPAGSVHGSSTAHAPATADVAASAVTPPAMVDPPAAAAPAAASADVPVVLAAPTAKKDEPKADDSPGAGSEPSAGPASATPAKKNDPGSGHSGHGGGNVAARGTSSGTSAPAVVVPPPGDAPAPAPPAKKDDVAKSSDKGNGNDKKDDGSSSPAPAAAPTTPGADEPSVQTTPQAAAPVAPSTPADPGKDKASKAEGNGAKTDKGDGGAKTDSGNGNSTHQ
jgi:RNA polymerase sigma factor (sigma-70 family)